jgi:hypothetical protein
LTEDWGLGDFKGQMMPVTVFTVEGEVTCDVLGKKVAGYAAADDVWDEVGVLLDGFM